MFPVWLPSVLFFLYAESTRQAREDRQWVNLTEWVCESTSAVTQRRKAETRDRRTHRGQWRPRWREAGWQERPFSQLFSFHFERTPFFNRSFASQRQRRQLALQQLISAKDGWMEESQKNVEGFLKHTKLTTMTGITTHGHGTKQVCYS